MKRVLTFLCRFPSNFVVSIAILCLVMLAYKEYLDERKWLLVMCMFAITFVVNLYTIFIQIEKLGRTSKKALWVSTLFIVLILGLSISLWLGLQSITHPKNLENYFVQRAFAELTIGITLWGIFSLLWNMRLCTFIRRHKKVHQKKKGAFEEYQELLTMNNPN